MKTGNTKKTQLLLIVFMIMGNQFSSAQNEILTENKLVVAGKRWVFQIASGEPPWEVYKDWCYEIENDTTIEEKNYKKLFWMDKCNQPRIIAGYIRETDDNKVYYRRISTELEEEYLLYDFGMEVGDTVFYEYEQDTSFYALDSTGLNENSQKLYFISKSHDRKETWIEGVGSETGLLKEQLTGGAQYFTCCFSDGELLYQNSEFESCYFEAKIFSVAVGNDTTFCSGFGQTDTLFSGSGLKIENGAPPYSYRWETKLELTPNLIFTASDFLHDTTSANPYFIDWLTLPDRIHFIVYVTDAKNNTAKDSITVGFSGCACYTGYQVIHLNEGDSVWLDAGIPSGNTKKIYWEPSYGLSNPDSSATWCKPDSTMNYSIVSIDTFGCVCSCHAYEIRVNEDTNSQHNYRELVQEGKIWSNTSIPSMPGEYRSYWIKFEGDTIINGLEYKKALRADDSMHSEWYLKKFIREDVANQKVYLYNNFRQEDLLLYDFSLEQGDSILTWAGYSAYVKVDTVLYEPFGNSTDTLKQICFFSSCSWKWIEGIGSLSGILEGLNAFYLVGGTPKLVCYYENNNLIYHNPDFETCFPEGIVSVAMFDNKENLEIFPNPARDKITIYSQSSRILEVEIYDLTGTCIYRNLNSGSNRVNLETDKFPKGMYVLKVRNERDTISRKIVIQ